jgi:hypothetical protein
MVTQRRAPGGPSDPAGSVVLSTFQKLAERNEALSILPPLRDFEDGSDI